MRVHMFREAVMSTRAFPAPLSPPLCNEDKVLSSAHCSSILMSYLTNHSVKGRSPKVFLAHWVPKGEFLNMETMSLASSYQRSWNFQAPPYT
jgi:hypothetical protein